MNNDDKKPLAFSLVQIKEEPVYEELHIATLDAEDVKTEAKVHEVGVVNQSFSTLVELFFFSLIMSDLVSQFIYIHSWNNGHFFFFRPIHNCSRHNLDFLTVH